MLSLKEYKFINPIQNHTCNVVILNNDNINDELENVDGVITNLKGVVLTTKVADCQAILLYDPNKKVIGNIHSGWRGTLQKIVKTAIEIMISEYGCNPKDIIACISPSILSCCFEVKEDVYNLFKEKFNVDNYTVINKEKIYIDTVSINVDLLKKLGLLEENIICSNICTKCESDIYHSYRVDKENSGRNLAFIVLK